MDVTDPATWRKMRHRFTASKCDEILTGAIVILRESLKLSDPSSDKARNINLAMLTIDGVREEILKGAEDLCTE